MSKRKSRAKSMFVDKVDLVFEDDSDPEIVSKILNDQYAKASDAKKAEIDSLNVRISARAKKQKNIYDPSEFNGPVHKKKKEALEQAQLLAESKKSKQLSPAKSVASSKPVTKTPSKTPIKAAKLVHVVKSSPAITAKTANDVKKKLNMEKPETVPKQEPKTPSKVVQPAVVQPIIQPQVVKVPPKRVQTRKKAAIPVEKNNTVVLVEVAQDSATSSSGNSDFEKASTIEMETNKVPDVTKWTSVDVYNYFVNQGFDKRDALRLKEQEIDGEALLILNRNDLKDLQLKVGTFVKMWNRILTFQTGSNDFTQGWK